ncbi:MAG TPA: orotidine-5'-phosphate decarboxylase [bacterium]
MRFDEKIRSLIRAKNSLVCVGLDTVPEKIPESVRGAARIFEFNRAIINATKDAALAFKPNLAFYEALGTEGWDILKRTVAAMPDDTLKIGDAKRGDIGSTAEQYAKALFSLGFDAVTVNPYMGWDAVGPFVSDEEKGAFILCLSSNASAKDFQYLSSGGKRLYQWVAESAVKWNARGNCGLVVGATKPDELKELRAIAEDLCFLIPGFGVQGGDLVAAVLGGTDKKGEMAIINASRSILYASSGPDYAEAAGRQAVEMRDRINAARKKKVGSKQ